MNTLPERNQTHPLITNSTPNVSPIEVHHHSCPTPTDPPEKFQPLLQQELQPGESITWHAQPIPRWFDQKTPGTFFGSLFLSSFLLPVSVLFAPALPLALPQLADPKILFIVLFGGSIFLAFWAINIVMFTAPLRLYLRDKRTLYLLTNHRALILTLNWPKPKITSLPASSLTEIYRYQQPDGSGDLILQRALYPDSDDNPHELGFDSIRDVHHVETLTRQLTNPFPLLDLPATSSPLPESLPPIDPALSSLLTAELLPDETILLQATPHPRYRALHMLFFIPLGFLTIGAGIAALIGFNMIPPNAWPLWIIRPVQLGIILLTGLGGLTFFLLPFSVYRHAAHTLYAITTRRVITFEQTTRGFHIWSFAPHQLDRSPPLYNTDSLFGPPSVTLTRRTWTNPQTGESKSETLYLSSLTNYKAAEHLLRTLTDSANQPSPPQTHLPSEPFTPLPVPLPSHEIPTNSHKAQP